MDRNKGRVLAFKVGDRSLKTYLELAFELEKFYKIKHLCTDNYEAYKYYKISEYHHTTKAETSLVESFNSRMRDNLTRFNRRTKRFSKCIKMLELTLKMFWNKELCLSMLF